ncbi:hypothetical protein [Streptomyces sp. NPDC003247]|uniref:hypothetical protein n=1 Tax=Streptomyces sp. NPDC003247 TaxID=3364677 RepID=UPI00369576D9
MKTKPTTRGALAAVLTCVAAAAGAVAATPAAAIGTVPVPVPLNGVENSLHMELPEAAGEIPLPATGTPDGPRYAEGRLLPERVPPQVPVRAGLPGADLDAPLPEALGDDARLVGLEAPASELRTPESGPALDVPLTAPDADGLPGLRPPRAGVVGPVLQRVRAGDPGPGRGR